MWFFVLLVIAAIIVVIAVVSKKASEKAAAERKEKERIERQKRNAAEAQRKKAKYEIITETEKQALAKQDALEGTLKAFNMAVKGDSEAMAFMGYTYRLKLNNPVKSAYWIEKSANNGYLDAKFWLGKYYLHGYGVEENRIKGTNEIIMAAKKGNKLALESLQKDFNMSISEMRSQGFPV